MDMEHSEISLTVYLWVKQPQQPPITGITGEASDDSTHLKLRKCKDACSQGGFLIMPARCPCKWRLLAFKLVGYYMTRYQEAGRNKWRPEIPEKFEKISERL